VSLRGVQGKFLGFIYYKCYRRSFISIPIHEATENSQLEAEPIHHLLQRRRKEVLGLHRSHHSTN
jgi:hypothetical protein